VFGDDLHARQQRHRQQQSGHAPHCTEREQRDEDDNGIERQTPADE